MTYDDAIKALSEDALKLVKNHQIIGLGSGRAATAFVKSSILVCEKKETQYKMYPNFFANKIRSGKRKITSYGYYSR